MAYLRSKPRLTHYEFVAQVERRLNCMTCENPNSIRASFSNYLKYFQLAGDLNQTAAGRQFFEGLRNRWRAEVEDLI
jgi:ubiquitin C-terminal hydrolase